ncbi:MAG TPA: ABC transporter ATP-binding protein [Spirochaetota bacterium]|nr:ABC transporter ATP-binding protein [Spirochaetota bacterium]
MTQILRSSKIELFKINDLKINFPVGKNILQAVRGISFSLSEGEILGIVGESGSGKSLTTISMLNLLPKNAIVSGTILYKGENVFDFSKMRLQNFRGSKIGMIFQEPGRSFDPIYSIEKTFRETLLTHNKNLTKEEVYEQSIKLLKEVQIPQPEERIKNFPHQFSGGLLQRVMIALALSCNPEVLIADEPTTALDVTIQSQIVNLLLGLQKTRKISIIFISHNLSLISNIADRIIVMYGGLIMEEGQTSNVLKNPKHPYTKALLKSLPRFGDHYTDSKLFSINGNVPNPLKPETGCPFAPRCGFVKEQCKNRIPDLKNQPHIYRCII